MKIVKLVTKFGSSCFDNMTYSNQTQLPIWSKIWVSLVSNLVESGKKSGAVWWSLVDNLVQALADLQTAPAT